MQSIVVKSEFDKSEIIKGNEINVNCSFNGSEDEEGSDISLSLE